MAGRHPQRLPGGRVYYLLPDSALADLLQGQGRGLGPLGEPDPEPIIAPPDPEPGPSPAYGPRRADRQTAAGSPRGFFLDRYVY